MLRPCRSGFIALLALLAACGGGRVTMQPSGPRAADYSPADRLRVMLPPPGPGGDAAGRIVSARVVEVLQQTHGDVALVPTSSVEEASAAARTAKAVFVVSPTIVEWTDSHEPPLTADHIKVRLDLRDANAGDVVSSMTFENVSSLLAVTDTRPEALLDNSFDRAVTLLITTGATGRGTVREPGPTTLEHVPVDEQKYPRQ